jgi:CheY-like chemotaxis protein
VGDTGPGIEPGSLPKVFDRFFQADHPPAAQTGGTGIGLALVRELVLLMHGGLAVRNLPGQGAEFVVSLPHTRQAPLDQEPLPAQAQVRPQVGQWVEDAQVLSGHEPTLLLVEDNDDVATYIHNCLGTHYLVIRAENGQAGIELALEKMPDIILSDVMMPLKDGFELCDTLKNDPRTSHIPIVLLTAKAAHSDRLAGLRRGADAYLIKPFGREELLLVLANLIQTRRMLQAYYSQLALGIAPPEPVPAAIADSADWGEDAFLVKLRTTLEAHLQNTELSVDILCQEVGMSRTSLHLKVTALTGMSISHYVRSLRLRKAQELLTTSQLNVSQVAYSVGFDNPKYFSRVFSEEFGVSPANYRLSARG